MGNQLRNDGFVNTHKLRSSTIHHPKLLKYSQYIHYYIINRQNATNEKYEIFT